MTDIENLKKAILHLEEAAYYFEVKLPEFLDVAENYRIAVACMWEKLERMEKETSC